LDAAELKVPEGFLGNVIEKGTPEDKARAAKILKARAQVRALQAKSAETRQAAMQEAEKVLLARQSLEKEKVVKFIPDIKAKVPALKATLKDYGFGDDEIESLVDHRVVRLVHDAMQYQQAAAGGKDKPKASAPRPGKANRSATSKNASSAKAQKARLAHAKDVGSLDAWAEVLKGII
jgi:hypothetical protein